MAAKNDITGHSIQTGVTTKAYEDNWERIFGKKDKKAEEVVEDKNDGTTLPQANEG